MVDIKTREEIEIMREGGRILAEVLFALLNNIKPEVSEIELDNIAAKLIREKGGEPAFKRVKGYNHTICVSTNDVVVHGIPTEYRFKENDVVGIDCGVYYKGFNTDMAETISVARGPTPRPNIDRFLEAGRKALEEAIKVAKVGNRVFHISKTVQEIVEGAGYSVVRSLVGHGIGRELHEEPEVPGFIDKSIENSPTLIPGETLAIEVIYNEGKPDVVMDSDGWTIKTQDGTSSGLFERTVLISEKGPVVLTR